MTALFSIFKLLLKVAAAPVVAILALLVWFCTWLVYGLRRGSGTGQPAPLRLFGAPVPQFVRNRRHHLPDSGLFGKSFWAAYRRVMAVGQDSRTSVLDSGKRL